MKPADQLAAFVGDALSSGRTRPEIAAALARAGWTPSEVEAALDAWAEGDFVPPVPRPRPYVSAREAFTYALMFLALAVSSWNITALGFSLIDLWLPDPADPDMVWVASSIRWNIAVLVVALPLFLVLNVRSLRAANADPARRRSAVRKWFGYVTLFLAAVALLGDLVAVIYALLSGEMTVRFLAKAALVALIGGLVFLTFRGQMDDRDAR